MCMKTSMSKEPFGTIFECPTTSIRRMNKQISSSRIKRKLRNALSLVELLASMLITFLVLSVVLIMYAYSLRNWTNADRTLSATNQANIGVEAALAQLQMALVVTVSSNGQRVDYTVPNRDSNGNITIPMTADANARAMYWTSANNLVLQEGTNTRFIARNVFSTIPGTSTAYRLFTAGAEAITREVTVQLYCSSDLSGTTLTTTNAYARGTTAIRNSQ